MECPTCGGKGVVPNIYDRLANPFDESDHVDSLDDTTKLANWPLTEEDFKECPDCGGTGKVPD